MSSSPSTDDQDASSRAVEDHRCAFIAKLNPVLSSKDFAAYPTRKELHNKKVEYICSYKDDSLVSDLHDKLAFKQAYRWVKKYDLHNTLVALKLLSYKETPDINGRILDFDTYKTVSYVKTCFDVIRSIHVANMDFIQKLLRFFGLAKRSTGSARRDGPPIFRLPLALLASGL